MVQHQSETEFLTSKNYWKLSTPRTVRDARDLLIQRGLKYIKSERKPRLQELHSRAQRGLLHYDNFSVEELLQFCDDRQLQRPAMGGLKKSQKKKATVACLEKADAEATFDKFLDLPPELRNLVYEEYIADLEITCADRALGHAIIPTQPPLLRVSRLVRKEARPLFYEQMVFSFDFHGAVDWSSYVSNDQSWLYDSQEGRFFRIAPDSMIESIQKIRVRGGIVNTKPGPLTCDVRAEIGPKTKTIATCPRLEFHLNDSPESIKSVFEKPFGDRVENFCEGRMDGGEKFRLRREDGEKLQALIKHV